jgi:hypothetical protein
MWKVEYSTNGCLQKKKNSNINELALPYIKDGKGIDLHFRGWIIVKYGNEVKWTNTNKYKYNKKGGCHYQNKCTHIYIS